MIHITNFVRSPELIQHFQRLPNHTYQVVEGDIDQPKTFESSDLIIASTVQAKKLKPFLEKRPVSLILYFESDDNISNIYQLAQKLDAFAVLSARDLVSLKRIIDEGYNYIFEKRKSQFGQGKTIGVIASKGGVGKSFLAYHLASILSTFTNTEPVLIDAGVPFGSAHALLNITSKSSWQVLRPLLKTGNDLTPRRVNSQIFKTPFRFDLLNAPQHQLEELLSPEELSHLLSGVKQLYPISIVDLPVFSVTQMSKYALLFDLIVWVFTPDANSIVQTLESIKDIQITNSYTSIMVCNMVEPSLDASLLKSLQQKLSPTPILSIEQDSEAVKIYQRRFELLTDETLLLTQQLKELAQTVFFRLSE